MALARRSRTTPGSSRSRRPASRRADFLEALESRTLLTVTLDALPSAFGSTINLPAGKSIQVPLTSSSNVAGKVTYTITASNPSLVPLVDSINPAVSAARTFVQFNTSLGPIVVQLFNDVAPVTVNTFLSHLSSPDYTNSIFHRIVNSAAKIIQGGDRNGDGIDSSGLQVEEEYDFRVLYTGYGQLGEARTGVRDSGGSQFFFSGSPFRSWDFTYTIWGQVVRGWNVINAMLALPTTGAGDPNNNIPADRPLNPPTLNSVQVIQDPTDAVLTLVSTNTTPISGTITVTARDASGATDTKVFNVVTGLDNVNEPPILPRLSAVNRAIPANTSTTIAFPAVIDLENDPLTPQLNFTSSTPHASGTITNDGTLVLTPDPGYTGPIQLDLTVYQAGTNNVLGTRTYTFTVDGAAPTVTSSALKDLYAGAGAASTFTVTFADNVALDVNSIINNNAAVSVYGPNGFARYATFLSINNNTNGTSRTVTFQLVAPGGSWDAADAGGYLVVLNGGAIKDTVGNAVVATTLGKFYYSPSFLFDERYYLTYNSDVAAAVAAGGLPSGWAHFIANGQSEGRPATPFFNEGFYRAIYPDVKNAIAAGAIKSGWQHFLAAGIKEGRYSSPVYREADYLRFNPDIAAAVKAGGFSSGLEHFILAGQYENRRSSLYFNVNQYISSNPDVVAAVANNNNGLLKSVTLHFLLAGQKEGRVANDMFSETYYKSTYKDVANAMSAKIYQSAFEHFVVSGSTEKRNPSASFDTAYYLAHNPDVATLVATKALTAFEHYMLAGRAEGRAAHA
jgi:cyclophilin family peptidyl-prolyl cis-trans isomerase